MAGKTPVHSGVIFYPKDRIAVHAAVRSFSFHHKEVIHEERKKDKFPHCRYHTCRFRLPKEETSFRLCTLRSCGGSLYSSVGYSDSTGSDMWTQAETIMKDVYSKILGISTIAAIVTASVALLLMNFSKSGRTVDESRAWLKRIVISWAILNGLGFIMAYITPFFSGGQWNG